MGPGLSSDRSYVKMTRMDDIITKINITEEKSE
jgi:hypothetical protein